MNWEDFFFGLVFGFSAGATMVRMVFAGAHREVATIKAKRGSNHADR